MADPFQDVDAAGPAFIKMFADTMDARQSDPTMEKIVADYLAALDICVDSKIIEIGAGAGAVTRRIAAHAAPAKVTGYEPSKGFVAEARDRAKDHINLDFEVADGASLPLGDQSVDVVVMHTVLTHVQDPIRLLDEAFRVLKPHGALVVCDADFSKASLASFPNDPLDSCARAFVSDFVTDAHLVAKLRALVAQAGFAVTQFGMQSRVISDAVQMMPWVKATSQAMVDRGDIGQGLSDALVAEYERRAQNGTLLGYQVLATAIANKPG